MELVVTPAALLAVRPKARGDHSGTAGEVEVLIQWDGLPEFEATWEDFQAVQQQFPEFHLEDKVKVWGRGNVRPQIRFTYTRRKRKNVGVGADVGARGEPRDNLESREED